jgi:hypothetical protein
MDLDQILESAVIANWEELMRGAPSGLVHIEYGFVPTGTLDHLQIWSSTTRGRWLLACAWMSACESQDKGVRLENGYESEGLVRTLELVITHQNSFAAPPNIGRAGLLQVATPTQNQTSAAAASVNEAFDHLNFAFADLV